MNIQVSVFDDHPILREGVVNILNSQRDLTVIGEGSGYSEAVESCKIGPPDIVLLDISMPGGGIQAARDIHSANPEIKIIMLTASEDEQDVVSAFQGGVKAYILKGVGGAELISIVRKVSRGGTFITPSLASAILGHTTSQQPLWLEKLNSRENEVLELLSHGMTNRNIAENLFLSEKTIKHYASNIFQKLNVKNRVEAALMAQKFYPNK